jgi:hypothetical protein
MPSVETGPDQKHAFEGALAQVGFPAPGIDRLIALPPVCPSQACQRSALDLYAVRGTGSRYGSPLVMIAQIIRAILLASATAATFVVRRAMS